METYNPIKQITTKSYNSPLERTIERLENNKIILNNIKQDSETFKDVNGYEGIYQVSNLGNVKRIIGGGGAKKGRILKVSFNSNGYFCVKLCKEGVAKTKTIHRLVATAFIPNSENKKTVNHINGIITDNRLENLEWNTYSENNQHAFDIGLQKKGESHGNAKLTNKNVLEIRKMLSEKIKCLYIARKFGVSKKVINNIKLRKSWNHI